jgi:beta-lactamase regulating signal transducer with metallopeptidase domain
MNMESFHLPAWRWDTLVHAMLHSLWQAPLIAGLLWLALRSLSARHARTRYALCLLAHAGVLIATIATVSAVGRVGSGRYLMAQKIHNPDVSDPTVVTTEMVHVYGPVAIHRPWTTWAGWAWACGAGIALLRTAIQTIRAGALAERGEPVIDAVILKLIARLAGRLGIRRAICVVSSSDWKVPGVVGFVWPTLLLPAAMIGGIPPEQLAMILAHELAHIRRWDYLVNVWQQLVEAFLFFNPAVWWIGRQVRVEREACCDALAVAITGDANTAARTLADFAQHLIPSHSGLVLAGDGGSPGDLLDRIRRILRPDERLALAMPWYSTAVALISGIALLLLLGNGVNAVVVEAQTFLTPTERVDQIATMQQAIAAAQYSWVKDCNVSGAVRTADHSPLPADLRINMLNTFGSGYGQGIIPATGRDGHFTCQIAQGEVELAADANNYAPSFAGPFEAKERATFPLVDLVLDRGFPAIIHVVDLAGKPLAGAVVESNFVLARYGKFNNLAKRIGKTDVNGNCTLEHATSGAIAKLTTTCSGFQFSYENITLDPKTATTVRLVPATPTTCTIVDASTGQPITGATVSMAASDGSADNDAESFGLRDKWRPPPVLATSESAGRFNLSSLRNDSNYAIWVTAAGHGSELITGVHAGQKDLTIKMGPARVIHGSITGDFSRLVKAKTTNAPQLHVVLSVVMPSPTDSKSEFMSEEDIPVTVSNGVGTFEIDDPAPGSVELRPPGVPPVYLKTEDVVAHGPCDFVIPSENDEPNHRRTVIFKFDVPSGAPLPQGSLDVTVFSKAENSYWTIVVPIKDGVARYEVNAPTTIGYNGESLAGYCIGQKFGIAVDAGSDPFIVSIPAKPAGAARGQVLESDGSPSQYFSVSAVYIGGTDPNGYPPMLQPFNGTGTFLLTPFPFGSRYRFLARSDDRYILSDELGFDDLHPIQNLKFQFGPGQTLHVHIIAPDGQPAVGAKASLSLTLEGSGNSGLARKTDQNGDIAFDHLQEVEDGKYSVNVEPGWNYAEQMVRVSPGEGVVTIKLVAGLSLSGQVLNQLTNQPIAGAKVNANPGYHAGEPSNQPMSTVADGEGRFTFNNLAKGEWRLFVENCTPPGATVTRTARGMSYSLSEGVRDNLVTAGQSGWATLKVQRNTP